MMPDAQQGTVIKPRNVRWPACRLVFAVGVLLLIVAACAQENEGEDGTGASDADARPTVEMDTGDGDELSDTDDENADVPPKYVVNSVEDTHPDGPISMIAYGQEPTAYMDALMEGELALNGECLGVEGRGEGEFTSVVWPYEYSITVEGETVQLLDENGEVVASEGEMISVGGGNWPDPDGEIAEVAPEDCVAHSYWMAGSEVRLAEQTAEETPTPAGDSGTNVQTEEEALEQDAQMYAEAHDVSLDEAKRRLRLQQLPGPLQQALMENEADRFGGLYIEHEPEFRVVVQMTDGDEETVRGYIDDPELDEIVEVETVEASYRELEEAQQQAMDLVEELGVMASAGVSVQENRVEIYVADRAMLEDALEANEQELPEHVVIAGGEEESETLDGD